MKRNRMMRIASFLLIAVLATTCAISGTFAKYTSDFTGTGSARVATWSFEVNDAAPSVDNKFTFNLFDTAKIKDSNGTSAESDVDIDGDGTEKVIAPGTSGSISIKLENLSEVNAQYTLSLAATLDGIPLQYKVGEGSWTNMPTTDTVIVTATDIDMNGGTATIDIYWQWPFGESVVDNDHAGKTVEVTLKINATQKD